MTSFEKIMTQEEKELLLEDLCARLPYGVKISIPDLWIQKREIETLDEIFKGDDGLYRVNSKGQCIEHIKPYLFPLSSMTEEQDKEFALLQTSAGKEGFLYAWNCATMMKWLLENHFDYNCLIEKGLAIDATNKKIY